MIYELINSEDVATICFWYLQNTGRILKNSNPPPALISLSKYIKFPPKIDFNNLEAIFYKAGVTIYINSLFFDSVEGIQRIKGINNHIEILYSDHVYFSYNYSNTNKIVAPYEEDNFRQTLDEIKRFIERAKTEKLKKSTGKPIVYRAYFSS